MGQQLCPNCVNVCFELMQAGAPKSLEGLSSIRCEASGAEIVQRHFLNAHPLLKRAEDRLRRAEALGVL